jgi:serine/threonine protein kinase
MLGTVAYMSPEQGQRQRTGCAQRICFPPESVLYEMATGKLPFPGSNQCAEICGCHLEFQKPPTCDVTVSIGHTSV